MRAQSGHAVLSCKDDVRTQSLEGRTAMTKPQFATGPQKCVVIGPVGLLMNVLAHWAIPTEAMTMMADERWARPPSLPLPPLFFFVSLLPSNTGEGEGGNLWQASDTPWLYFCSEKEHQ